MTEHRRGGKDKECVRGFLKSILNRVQQRSPCWTVEACHLLNQFLVDMFAKIETERLLYIRLNQKQLRGEKYEHLRDALNSNEGNVGNLGRLVILPS
ncbi:hypothetical protein ACOMHN_064625 [Nucella lapillus]